MTKCVQYEFDQQPHLHPQGNSVTAGNCWEGQCVQLMTSDCSCAMCTCQYHPTARYPYLGELPISDFGRSWDFVPKISENPKWGGPPTL